MKGDHMDEHDPMFDPQAQEGTLDFLSAVARGLLWAAAIAMFLTLLGCEDMDRRLAEQEFRQRVFNACVPDRSEQFLPPHERTIHSVLIRWEDDDLVFHRITVSGRYGRTFPHTEIRVATIEGL
jgi:hypothetical protein